MLLLPLRRSTFAHNTRTAPAITPTEAIPTPTIPPLVDIVSTAGRAALDEVVAVEDAVNDAAAAIVGAEDDATDLTELACEAIVAVALLTALHAAMAVCISDEEHPFSVTQLLTSDLSEEFVQKHLMSLVIRYDQVRESEGPGVQGGMDKESMHTLDCRPGKGRTG